MTCATHPPPSSVVRPSSLSPTLGTRPSLVVLPHWSALPLAVLVTSRKSSTVSARLCSSLSFSLFSSSGYHLSTDPTASKPFSSSPLPSPSLVSPSVFLLSSQPPWLLELPIWPRRRLSSRSYLPLSRLPVSKFSALTSRCCTLVI